MHCQIKKKKYKLYRNCLIKIKRKGKIDYYTKQCYTLKSDTKKLWQLINRIINQSNDKSSVINYITVDKIRYYDAKSIANNFREFYSNIGANLAGEIKTNGSSINDYLDKIKINPNMMYLHPITPSEIHRFIDNLPAKNSSG